MAAEPLPSRNANPSFLFSFVRIASCWCVSPSYHTQAFVIMSRRQWKKSIIQCQHVVVKEVIKKAPIICQMAGRRAGKEKVQTASNANRDHHDHHDQHDQHDHHDHHDHHDLYDHRNRHESIPQRLCGNIPQRLCSNQGKYRAARALHDDWDAHDELDDCDDHVELDDCDDHEEHNEGRGCLPRPHSVARTGLNRTLAPSSLFPERNCTSRKTKRSHTSYTTFGNCPETQDIQEYCLSYTSSFILSAEQCRF